MLSRMHSVRLNNQNSKRRQRSWKPQKGTPSFLPFSNSEDAFTCVCHAHSPKTPVPENSTLLTEHASLDSGGVYSKAETTASQPTVCQPIEGSLNTCVPVNAKKKKKATGNLPVMYTLFWAWLSLTSWTALKYLLAIHRELLHYN